ncbi:MAG TPA: type II toxin-antitoxin system RelE/ParE family toxin [Bryobacteraceae bacterium]|nr:type II toxin-antitoxin system RelE/ParE family toxin [Bryobacteraceae bacterium]
MRFRKTVVWDGRSQEQLLAIDRETALAILHAIDDYLTDGSGDVKRLRPPRHELRLRVGDYRVFFPGTGPRAIRILAVKHRSEAYR